MNVVVDLGNTAAKIGIFEDHASLQRFSIEKIEDLRGILNNFSGDGIIVSSVNQEYDPTLIPRDRFLKSVFLTPETALPIVNHYETPKTLGMDRIAAACGAWQLFPGMNSLVVDAGTCVTYEFVSQNGIYEGGAIAPGLRMRFKAMHTFTARLPLVEPVPAPPLTGKSTITCMQSGVVCGMTDEIDGAIRRYGEIYPDLRVILCGGDTPFFENRLKASIFASPELVLVGLNSILLHNANL